MIHVTHIPTRRREPALRDAYAIEPVVPTPNHWSACLITSDHTDYLTSMRHGGSATLVPDPVIDGYHLTHVLMDGGSSLNLICQDTIHRMGIDPSRINHSNTTFEGVIPGVEAHCRGSPGYFRSKKLLFAIAPPPKWSRIARENGLCPLQCSTALCLH